MKFELASLVSFHVPADNQASARVESSTMSNTFEMKLPEDLLLYLSLLSSLSGCIFTKGNKAGIDIIKYKI